ncbi:MAG: RNA polymerase sigma factor [Chitinophagales bacterium]|nr:RNA polymerase sigma factor [Bacteroidota bacterium]MCB9042276.1 RNA polymerase sigma factor [Chitinophagales bacterium]
MASINFKEMVVQNSARLTPFALNLTKDFSDAQDLVQETIYRALVNENLFRPNTNLKAWLFTIMKNIFINNYRRKVKQNTIIDTTDNLFYLNTKADGKSIGNQAEANFMMEDMQKAISELAEEYRLPFLMHYKGYKYQEIADQLKLPLGTVKSRIFFARKELKDKLAIYSHLV